MIDLMTNNDEPFAWLYFPSQKRIAFISGLTRKVVHKAMKQLVSEGLIGSKRMGLGRQNIYCVLRPDDDFVREAIRRRCVLLMIKQERITWDDIDDFGTVTDEDIVAEIDAVVSSFPPKDNPLTHIQSQMSPNGTSVSPNEGQQQVPNEDTVYTSVGVTSDEITSVTTKPIVAETQQRHSEKPSFPSYRKRLKGDKLQAFDLIAKNFDKVVGKTLLELVQQSPVAVTGAYHECKQRDVNHFGYFTKVFFSHFQKGVKHESAGTTVDYDNIDDALYK
jgi:hypothetical protein